MLEYLLQVAEVNQRTINFDLKKQLIHFDKLNYQERIKFLYLLDKRIESVDSLYVLLAFGSFLKKCLQLDPHLEKEISILLKKITECSVVLNRKRLNLI
jgi:hypothetical protein